MMLFNSLANRSIFFLSLIGLAVSMFLVYEYNQSTPVICPITGSGCEQVRQSDYAHLFGIDLPYYGIVFYLWIAGTSVWLTQHYNKRLIILRTLASILGVIFGIYLTFLEAFIIKAYCIWCLTSFLISVTIMVVILLDKKGSAKNEC